MKFFSKGKTISNGTSPHLNFIFSILTFAILTNCTTEKTPPPWPTAISQPNVIIILADDMGFGDLQSYNPESKIPTPHLDKLAQEGIRFTDVHSPASVCTPTRYALLTGRYAWRTRLKEKVLWPYAQPLIDTDRKTLPDLFKEQGYQTAMFGKWHLGWKWALKDSTSYPWEKKMNGNWGGKGIDLTKQILEGPNGAGFDYAFGVDYPNSPPYAFIENGKIVGPELVVQKPETMFGSRGVMQKNWRHENVLPSIIDKTKGYLDTVSNPFFIYLSLTSPHTPIVPLESFAGKSNAGDYGDFIAQTDTHIGEIFDVLDARGLRENTLVIFTSDNGSPAKAGDPFRRGKEYDRFGEVERRYGHYPNAPLKDYKASLYEGGHRVPFIASWRGTIQSGQTSNMLFGLQDLIATFHRFFGENLEDHEGEDSYDVSAYLFKNRQDTIIRDHIIMHGGAGTFALRVGDWKFIADSSSGGTSLTYKELLGTYESENPGQLYNLGNDLGEEKDLYLVYPEKAKALRQLLLEYIDKGRSTSGIPQKNDPYNKPWEQVDRLRSTSQPEYTH